MERLCCKIRCIYLVGTIMGVTLVTFRYAQLNKTTHKAISMHSKLSAMAFKHVSHVAYAVLLLLIKSALNRASHLIHSLQSLSISLHGCSRKKKFSSWFLNFTFVNHCDVICVSSNYMNLLCASLCQTCWAYRSFKLEAKKIHLQALAIQISSESC